MRLAEDNVVVSCAGHPPPLLVREDGRIREIGSQGPILGAWTDSEWVDRTMPLGADETLFIYTDGVIDTVGKQGRFGARRLRRVLIEHAARSPEEVLSALEAELEGFQLEGQSDDTATLALRLAPDAHPGRSDRAGCRAKTASASASGSSSRRARVSRRRSRSTGELTESRAPGSAAPAGSLP